MSIKLGSADFAVQVILRAWFESLKTDSQAWENALYKFPDDIVADTRQMFLKAKEPIDVISGFPHFRRQTADNIRCNAWRNAGNRIHGPNGRLVSVNGRRPC